MASCNIDNSDQSASLQVLLDSYRYVTVADKTFHGMSLNEALFVLNKPSWRDSDISTLILCLRKHERPIMNLSDRWLADPFWAEDILFAADVINHCKFLRNPKHDEKRIPILLHIYAIATLLREAYAHGPEYVEKMMGEYRVPEPREIRINAYITYHERSFEPGEVVEFPKHLYEYEPVVSGASDASATAVGEDAGGYGNGNDNSNGDDNNDSNDNANEGDEQTYAPQKASRPRKSRTQRGSKGTPRKRGKTPSRGSLPSKRSHGAAGPGFVNDQSNDDVWHRNTYTGGPTSQPQPRQPLNPNPNRSGSGSGPKRPRTGSHDPLPSATAAASLETLPPNEEGWEDEPAQGYWAN
ncbi:hypothetical protein F4781DRAFT_361918 [Annulohypoxylon bovei var. microspora]|nr:hypothetical protein F4781DRAFT_361918 [Annulohypoxylon bovei var. microspora]